MVQHLLAILRSCQVVYLISDFEVACDSAEVQREEAKVQKSIKECAKRGDVKSAKVPRQVFLSETARHSI